MTKRTAKELAKTLRHLVENGYVPGLLPEDVHAAADLLEKQDDQIRQMSTVLATNEHTVQIEAKKLGDFHGVDVKLTFGIVSPRAYWAEYRISPQAIYDRRREDMAEHIGRHLFKIGSREWQDEMEAEAVQAAYGCTALWEEYQP